MVSGSFEEIHSCLQKLTQELANVFQVIDHAAIGDDVSLRDLPKILTAAGRCRSAMTAIQATAAIPELIGSAYCGVNTDIEPIKLTVLFAESIASGSLPCW